MDLEVAHLFIYPIKSLAGIEVDTTFVEEAGFRYDRSWMIIDEKGRTLTQRDIPEMALLQPSLEDETMTISHKQGKKEPFSFNIQDGFGNLIEVAVWNSPCMAREVSPTASKAMGDMLGITCKLVYKPTMPVRPVDPEYAVSPRDQVGFADGYPILAFDLSSLEDLNSRLEKPVPMSRFRPNIVFKGGHPYAEDELKEMMIGWLTFHGVKNCSRCKVISIDQETAESDMEAMKMLNSYRQVDARIKFGRYLIPGNIGVLNVGDKVLIKETTDPIAF